MSKFFRFAVTTVYGFFALSALAQSSELDKAPSGKYELEPTHGYISFSYSHMGFSNPILKFNRFNVLLEFDGEEVENSTLEVEIDAASIDSGVAEFDGHLREKNHFFDTENYPQMKFVSEKITHVEDDRYLVSGNLLIKETSHPVSLNTTINGVGVNKFSNRPTIGVSATGDLNRSDWGLDYAVPLVGDRVGLRIEVELHTDPLTQVAEDE